MCHGRVFQLLHKHVILSDTAPRQWTGHRPGCYRGGAGVGVTEFSRVWAYNPYLALEETVSLEWPFGTVLVKGPKTLEFFEAFRFHRATEVKANSKDITSVVFTPVQLG
jgi:hypothetical protein